LQKAREAAPPDALAELEKYGLGAVRSLGEYQRFARIDFKSRLITPDKNNGRY